MKVLKNVSLSAAMELIEQEKIEITDCIESVLIDNLIGYKNDDLYFFRDTFVNSNMSVYTVYISETKQDQDEIIKAWDQLYQAYYQED